MAVTPSGGDSGATKSVPAKAPADAPGGTPVRVTPGKTGKNLDPVKGN